MSIDSDFYLLMLQLRRLLKKILKNARGEQSSLKSLKERNRDVELSEIVDAELDLLKTTVEFTELQLEALHILWLARLSQSSFYRGHEPPKETMKQEARRNDAWAGLASQISLPSGGSGLNPQKVR